MDNKCYDLPEFPLPPNGVDLLVYYCSADRGAGLAGCVYVLTPRGIQGYGVPSEHTILRPGDADYQEAESLWRAAMVAGRGAPHHTETDLDTLCAEVTRLDALAPADLMAAPHGDGLAVYSGRDSEHHGLRLFNVTDGDAHAQTVLDLLCEYRRATPRLVTEVQRLVALRAQEQSHASVVEARLREFEKPVVGSGARVMTTIEAQAEVISRLRQERDEARERNRDLAAALSEAQRVLQWGHNEMRGRPPQHWLDALEIVARALAAERPRESKSTDGK